MSPKRLMMVVLGLLGAGIILVLGAVLVLVTIDLRPLIERYASRALDRRLAIDALAIGWGDPLTIELSGLRLANASWGSRPEMVEIDSLSAVIDPWPLLRGELRYRKLRIVKPRIILERNAQGAGNWRFAGGSSPGIGIVPKNRGQFPTLLDFALEDGTIEIRTSSGALLRLDMHTLTIGASDGDAGVALALEGAYNGAPAKLRAETQSFALLRDKSVPFGTDLTIALPSASLAFKGTMMEPLDFEGVRGPLRVDARKLGDFLKIFGTELDAAYPLQADGALDKSDGHWRLSTATGKLAENAFTGSLALEEAPHGKPDALSLALDFPRLDLDPLLTGSGKVGSAGPISLRLEAKRGTNIEARIAARQLAYGAMRFTDAALNARLASGEVAVDRLSLGLAGGTLEASGSARRVASPGQEAAPTRLVASATFSNADAAALAALIGADTAGIAGRIDGAADLAMTGGTVSEALSASDGHAVLSMRQGRISRDLVEKASTDLRTLFRKGKGSAEILCLLGVLDLQNGLGRLAPLRLRTPETTLFARGAIDFLNDRLDLTLEAEGSKSLFALDVPIRINGTFGKLSVAPAIGASPRSKPPAESGLAALPPALKQFAERNRCPG